MKWSRKLFAVSKVRKAFFHISTSLRCSILLLALLDGLGGAQPQKDAPLSVCELVQNRMKYDGKMVEVRGIDESWSEGWVLSDANCPTHIVEKGLDFANAINLSLYLEITSPHWDSAAYIPDRDQIDKVDREVGTCAGCIRMTI